MSFPFTDVWDTLYEGTPQDTENRSLGAARIRSLKSDIHQRLAIDHSWNGNDNDGKHTQVTLQNKVISGVAVPPLDPSDGLLYASNKTGRTELYYQDDAQNTTQLTDVGSVAFQGFVAGTTLPFIQAAAPTGWVQSTLYNDQVLRTSGGNGGGVGGSWTITGLSGATVVAGHALTVAEIPSHTHNVNAETATGGNIGFNAGNSYFLGQFAITSDGGSGGNGVHTHGATTSVSADGNWRPAYVDAMVCVKT